MLNSKIRVKNSLRYRICILLFAIGIIPVLLVSAFVRNYSKQEVISYKQEEIRSQSKMLATQLSSKTYAVSNVPEDVKSVLTQLSNMIGARVILLDENCRIIKDTYDLDNNKIIISEAAVSCLTGKKSNYSNMVDNYVEMAFPIKDSTQTSIKGVLVVLASVENDVENATVATGRLTILEIIISIVVLILAFVLSKLLMRPFTKLSQSIEEISEGFSGENLVFEGYEEMKQLSDAMNTMVGKMKTLDDSRQEFVSNVSHELKTPITSMKVLADSLLVQDDVPVELYKEFMLDIADEIDRENKIINDLLSLVKLDKSSSDLNIAPITINDLLELILKRLRPIAAKRNIELVFESFRPVTAEVDEVKLTLAFSNLIENAIKYNVENGWVHVSLNADHKFFYVKVADSGIGIPEESLDNIFERFYRVDKSHSREIGGTGLGLAITRSAVLKHRGAIKVYSKEDEGTTFTVRIPLNFIFQ